MPINPVGFESDHVQPAEWVLTPEVPLRECRQPPLGRPCEAPLLAQRYASGGPAAALRASPPHFDKHQLHALAHHQIKFAKRTSELSGEQCAACPFKQSPGHLFKMVTYFLLRGSP